jgi:predicted DNA-binding protein YlxM (UPF0122 family)
VSRKSFWIIGGGNMNLEEFQEPNPAHRPVRTVLTSQQERYVQLRLTTKLSFKQIADQIGVHYNTITNWNKTQIVQDAIEEQIIQVRKDNMIGMQRLMGSLIREAENVLSDDEVGNTIKIQLIGQLFSQAGKFSGLEPVKQVQKQVNVVKSFEQMVDCGAIDVDVE